MSLTISSRVAFSLSSYLDLNDLHSLSLTCRSIHSSFTQYAKRLKSNSLKCAFDSQPLLSELIALQLSSSAINSDSQIALTGADRTEASLTRPQFFQSLYSSRGPGCSSSKISACARDLVAECRKCGTPVCRNCIAKAPSDRYLKERHRRLCQKCLKAPLAAHLEPLKQVEDDVLHDTPPMSSASSTRSARSTSEASSQSLRILQKQQEPLRPPSLRPLSFVSHVRVTVVVCTYASGVVTIFAPATPPTRGCGPGDLAIQHILEAGSGQAWVLVIKDRSVVVVNNVSRLALGVSAGSKLIALKVMARNTVTSTTLSQ